MLHTCELHDVTHDMCTCDTHRDVTCDMTRHHTEHLSRHRGGKHMARLKQDRHVCHAWSVHRACVRRGVSCVMCHVSCARPHMLHSHLYRLLLMLMPCDARYGLYSVCITASHASTQHAHVTASQHHAIHNMHMASTCACCTHHAM